MTELLIIPEVWITTLATVFLIPITNYFTHICNDMINKPSPLHYFKGNGGKCNRLFYFSPKTKIKNPDYSFENLYMIVRKIDSFLLGLNYLIFHLFCFEFQ